MSFFPGAPLENQAARAIAKAALIAVWNARKMVLPPTLRSSARNTAVNSHALFGRRAQV